MRKILLTSTGFTNKNLEKIFINNIEKPISEVRVLFVPTAAIDEESKETIPFCREDLTNAGVIDDNIIVYNLDRSMDIEELLQYDAIYFCGGSEIYLMEKINEVKFAPILLEAINRGLFYIGVSAGSMILSTSVPNNIKIIPNPLEPFTKSRTGFEYF